jgi:hypothetical protein
MIALAQNMETRLARRIVQVLALYVVFMLAEVTTPAAGNGMSGLLMKGSITKGVDGGYYLDVTLTNESKDPISIPAIKLPWAADHWDSWIKGMKLDARRTQLEPGGALIDYGGQLHIQPRETLKGQVPLHAMFPTLLHDIDAHGVRIEWRCPNEVLPVVCPTKTSGYVISKSGIKEEKTEK